jgi:23S rRNA-/tRNA-specific pseudouridylate synthase
MGVDSLGQKNFFFPIFNFQGLGNRTVWFNLMIRLNSRIIKRLIVMKPFRSENDIKNSNIVSRNSNQSLDDLKPVVLQQNDDYLVINKPYDVRMDGDFNVTVEKMLKKWIPNIIKVNETMKWVHQLDYATSGVLCIALHRESASLASACFSNRETNKQYLAVLQGHINSKIYPSRNQRIIHSYKASDNIPSKKFKKAESNDSWQYEVMITGLTQDFELFQKLLSELSEKSSDTNTLTEKSSAREGVDKDVLLKELQLRSFEDFKNNFKLRKKLRKLLKSYGIVNANRPSSIHIPDSSSNEQELETKSEVSPTVTAIIPSEVFTSNEEYIYRLNDEKIIITIPLKENLDDFRCYASLHHSNDNSRPCETEMDILEYGYYCGEPVTKVLFTPITGRRHQLRIHSLCLGHPIVGDGTYNTSTTCDSAYRMMLHAWKLHVPVKNLNSIETADPFIFKDNNLIEQLN